MTNDDLIARRLAVAGLQSSRNAIARTDVSCFDLKPAALLPFWHVSHFRKVLLRIVARDEPMTLSMAARHETLDGSQDQIFEFS